MTLASEIAHAKLREQISEFEQNEARVAATLTTQAREPLSNSDKAALAPFLKWCASQNVRHCPAKPTTVAAFVMQMHADEERLLEVLGAIERMHDAHGLPNPTATAAVNAACDSTITIRPPRSWPREDKLRFDRLPAAIRSVIARREQERDAGLRRAQTAASQQQTKKELQDA